MKLLYIWLENYNNRIVKQGFNFSPEFEIRYNDELNELTIKKNTNYIDGFYGSNILDITAVVGENGAGKTTLTKCIYEICHSVNPVDDEIDEENDDRIIVYKDEKSTNHKAEVIILYFTKKKLEILSGSDNIVFKPICLNEMTSDCFMSALEEHKMSTVFFTNAFDISHIISNQGLTESDEGLTKKSMCFSPVLMLKREMRHIKNSYGAQSIESGLIFNVIQQYAEKMGIDVGDAYTSAFSYNFLLTVRHTPNAIAVLLPVLSEFQLSVVPFGKYILEQQKFGMMSQFDKSIYFIRKNIYEKIIGNLSKNNWEKIYANILCEIVMFSNALNGDYINTNFIEIEKNNISINSSKAFEMMMAQVENLKKRDLIGRIRNVERLDMKIIDDFLDNAEEIVPPLVKTKWFKQVENFKNLYQSKKKYLKIPDKIDCGYTELIEILLEEHYKNTSFWNRMIRVIPSPMSSGETALINIFSSIYKLILEQTEKNILLIIDEIDAFLHPKWQQDIVTHIIRWINEEEVFKEKKVQIIFASHSPIILSDIPMDRIIYLSKLCRVIQKETPTFGANINRLFYDSFFMEDGSIGTFAKYKIQKCIDNIEGKKKNMTSQEIEYIINNIGEPFVKKKLQKDMKYKRLTGEYNDKS